MAAADRERVAAYYNRLAPVYGDGQFFAARRASVLAAMADELAMAQRLLDLGCGNGAFGIELAERSPRTLIVGADLSRGMLHEARQRLGQQVPLVEADACALPFRSGTFDLIFMSHVLLLVPDIERCVAEIARGLAPGGTLVATVGAGGWRAALGAFGFSEGLLRLATRLGARHLPTSDDTTRANAACRAAGLHPESRRAPFSVTWPALEEWIRIRWLTTLDEPFRSVVRLWLSATHRRHKSRTLSLDETVLVATKP